MFNVLIHKNIYIYIYTIEDRITYTQLTIHLVFFFIVYINI